MYEDMKRTAEKLENAMAINDWNRVSDEFASINKQLDKAKASKSVVERGEQTSRDRTPNFYIACIVKLAETVEASVTDQEKVKKMSKTKQKWLKVLRKNIRKNNANYEREIAEFKENSGSIHQELTKLTADRLSAVGRSWRRPTRDDDESSVASMASTFSNVSVQPSAHARQRAIERRIMDREVQEAKKNGCISLAICSGNDLDMPRGDIRRWGTSLVEAFDGVSLGEPELRGSAGDRRIELVLAGSEMKGQRIKQWLKDEGYFEQYSKRMLYARRQGDRELVVVEGRVPSGVVGIITTFRRDKAGRETDRIDTKQEATHAQMLLSNGDDDMIPPVRNSSYYGPSITDKKTDLQSLFEMQYRSTRSGDPYWDTRGIPESRGPEQGAWCSRQLPSKWDDMQYRSTRSGDPYWDTRGIPESRGPEQGAWCSRQLPSKWDGRISHGGPQVVRYEVDENGTPVGPNALNHRRRV